MKNKMKTITKINAKGKEISSMDAADFLDSAIRKKESEKGTYSYGYKINNCVYRNYINNDAWTAFLQDLKEHYPSIYSSFQKCKGSELKERRGVYPPKMASSGSSSFFAVEQLKNIHNIKFEKELKKRVCKGINPQIDAFVKIEKTNIFVEVKCHEIYDKIYKGSKSYKKVYDSIGQGLKFDENTGIFSLKGASITSFDIKQIICHFLGICAEVLEDRTTPTVRFIYLLYNPNAVKKYMTERQWSEVEGQYNKCKKEIDLFGDMKWLFDAIYKFQRENLTKKRLIKYRGECAFEFCVADQDDCLGYFTE